MGKPISIAFLGDTHLLERAEAKAKSAIKGVGDEAVRQGSRIDSSFESTAGHADNVASKGSQAAGAFSGLGSLAQSAGGNVGALGTTMVIAGTATQGLADAGDLLNVVTESTIVKTAIAKVQMVGHAIATGATTVATTAYTGAQWLLNAALSANPIGILVVGLTALVVGLGIAYAKSSKFRAIVNGAFGSVISVGKSLVGFFVHDIPNAVTSTVGFVRTHWKPILIAITGPIGLAIVAVTSNLDKIKSAFNNVVGFVGGIPGRIRGLVSHFADAGGDLIGGLVHGLANPVGSVGPIAASIVNGVIDFLNSHLPHSLSINKGPIHVSVPLFPTIPRLANGGIVNGPGLFILGDNPGGREAVIPLDKYNLGSGRPSLHIDRLDVHVPYGASAYDVGEALVEKLRAFFDGGGTI